MDKKKYDIVIAGVEMSILSDEREEFVTRLVSKLDEDITAISTHNKRCSTLDAALLVALDVSSERAKAEKRVRNLEAQIALYDANLRRMRDENIKLKSALLGKQDADYKLDANEAAASETAEEKEVNEEDQLTIKAEPALEPKTENESIKDKAANDEKADAPEDKGDKLRQIESLLRGRNI